VIGSPTSEPASRSSSPRRRRPLATNAVSRHAVGRQAEFTLLLHLADGEPNPLPQIAEAAAFRRALLGWSLAAPEPQEMTVLGNYRMLD
jgi:hypothetical protein